MANLNEKAWDVEVIAGIYTRNANRVKKALRLENSQVDLQVLPDDEHHYYYGQYQGRYNQAYCENLQAYVSGAYPEWVCVGDTALMLAVKTGDPSIITTIMEFNPNIELTNQKGDRAADIARRNGVSELLNQNGVSGVKLSY